jgi:outer membrane protein TolC
MLKFLAILSFLFLVQLSTSLFVKGQTGNSFNEFKDDIIDKLPPLSVLIDSAILRNGNVHYKDQQLIINECKLRSKKVEWTRNIGMQVNVGYGNLFNYSSSSTGSIDPLPTSSTQSQTQYNGALYLNMPFYTLIDRKNMIKIAKTEIEQAQSNATAQRDEIRQQVLLYYNDLILKQRIFKILVKNLESGKMNMEMVEKQFSNGVLPLSEYTKMLNEISRLETDLETARMDFLSAYMILEVITGIKFNLFSTIPATYGLN